MQESYAKLHAISLDISSTNFFERIEDEYDVSVAKDAYDEYVENGCKSRPVSEVWKELDL